MKSYLPPLAGALLCGLALAATSAGAATAVHINSPSDTFDASTLTVGFRFTMTSNRYLTALGAFDEAGDGLFFDVPVGIWDSEGTLLASTVVGRNDARPLEDGFRYNDITRLALMAGESYVVGAFYPGDFATGFGGFLGGSATVDKHLTINEQREIGTGKFELPTIVDDAGAFLGPNLKLANGVPEPAAWALMIAGFGLVGAQLRSRRGIAA